MEDLVTIAALATYPLFIAWDFIRPARRFPKVRLWRVTGLLSFLVMFGLASVVPALLTPVLEPHRLLDLSGLGTWGGAMVGLLVYELAFYGWHRLMHGVPWLWRWTHQMHHSAERVDIWGFALFHPFDMLANFVLTTAVTTWLLGLSAGATAVAGAMAFFLATFQHANIRTPRWLGYLIQRPEAHGVHHQRGVHAYNFSDLPVWDMLFGTFRNPATWDEVGGFYDGSSRRLGAMLVGRDVGAPTTEESRPRPRRRLAA